MKIYILILIILGLVIIVNAQQLPQISQRTTNVMIYNPAYVGATENPEILLHYRSQWVGFTGAPATQLLSYNGKVNDNMGLGGYLVNDITGPSRRVTFNANYAYHLEFDNFKLSLGIAATVMQYGIDGNKITIKDQTDVSVQEGISDIAWKPDASFGTYIYSNKFFVGLSVMQLIGSKVKLYNSDFEGEIPLARHFYIISGYHIDFEDELIFTPSFLFNTTIGSPSQIDFNCKIDYLNKVFGSITFRYNDAVVLMGGIKIKEQFSVAYSYDIVTSNLKKYNSGSHEIILSFTILPADNSDSLL